MNIKSLLTPVLVLLATGTASAQLGTPFDECGILILDGGGQCVQIQTPSGTFNLDTAIPAPFALGDTVRVTGDLDLTCFSICFTFDGCIWNTAIQDCSPPVIGTNFCTSSVNDTGMPATISASGSASVGANDLVLSCGPVGSGQPGIFFYSDNPSANPNGIPFGEGARCVVGSLVRLLPPVAENNGVLTRPVDYNSLPSGASIVAGDTFYFQGWYRDTLDNDGDGTAEGFNLSDGLGITFLP